MEHWPDGYAAVEREKTMAGLGHACQVFRVLPDENRARTDLYLEHYDHNSDVGRSKWW